MYTARVSMGQVKWPKKFSQGNYKEFEFGVLYLWKILEISFSSETFREKSGNFILSCIINDCIPNKRMKRKPTSLSTSVL